MIFFYIHTHASLLGLNWPLILVDIFFFCKFNMPQLIPFYFINQVTFVFLLIVILLYVFSKYLLPKFVSLFTTRLYITKL